MSGEQILDKQALRAGLGSGSDWLLECGRNVSNRRHALGLTQQQLADLVGMPVPTISKIEVGGLAPRDYLRISLAAALGCEVADLFPWPSKERVARIAAHGEAVA